MKAAPPIFVAWYELSMWLFQKTNTFPKKIRYTFTNRIDNLVIAVMEGIIEARYSSRKNNILHRVDLDLEKLRVFLRMCHDLKYLDHKGYEYAAKQINEVGKMLGGWKKQHAEKRS